MYYGDIKEYLDSTAFANVYVAEFLNDKPELIFKGIVDNIPREFNSAYVAKIEPDRYEFNIYLVEYNRIHA